jgi:hypothetical protein
MITKRLQVRLLLFVEGHIPFFKKSESKRLRYIERMGADILDMADEIKELRNGY